jgi:hypothetical protein
LSCSSTARLACREVTGIMGFSIDRTEQQLLGIWDVGSNPKVQGVGTKSELVSLLLRQRLKAMQVGPIEDP